MRTHWECTKNAARMQLNTPRTHREQTKKLLSSQQECTSQIWFDKYPLTDQWIMHCYNKTLLCLFMKWKTWISEILQTNATKTWFTFVLLGSMVTFEICWAYSVFIISVSKQTFYIFRYFPQYWLTSLNLIIFNSPSQALPPTKSLLPSMSSKVLGWFARKK